MKADYLSYRKAAGVAILGLVLQAAQALSLLIYGLVKSDHAVVTSSMLVGLGVLIWLALAIIFDQHRRERVEALEAEAFDQSQGASSVFESSGDEFKSAARRLAGLYKYFLPIVSIVAGGTLLAVGLFRFFGGRARVQAGGFIVGSPDGWAIALGLALAVIGFVFARYVSGMAKQKVWANLRGGATYAVIASLIGLAVSISHFVDYAGPDTMRRYMPLAVPVFMVILGAEVFLNFVLDLYRPRKPGELPRPAFDSRILAFVAAPDRIAQSVNEAINYQLGFDVSSSWFYQLLSRRLGVLLLVGVAVVWGMSAFAVIQPHQHGMVLRFGEFKRVMEPGLNVKLPWPIEKVEIPVYTRKSAEQTREVINYTTTGVRMLDLGTPPPANAGAILWTNDHVGEEVYQIVQPSRVDVAFTGSIADQRDAQGSGVSLIAVEIPMYYVVRDIRKFDEFAPTSMRDDTLSSVARREILRYMSRQNVDDLLGSQRVAMGEELRASIQKAFDSLNPDSTGTPRGAGVEIIFLGITNAHPNKQVAQNFERVVQADRYREAKIETARKDEIETLTKVVGSTELANRISEEIATMESMSQRKDDPAKIKEQELKIQRLLEQAGGSAAALVANAKAQRWERHMGERGRASRYMGQIAAFQASPMLFRAGEYFAAMQAAMAGSRVYLVNERVRDLHVRTELQDVDTGVGVFEVKSEEDQY